MNWCNWTPQNTIGLMTVPMLTATDDTTGKVLALYFTKDKITEACCELAFQTNKTYGLPKEFYADGRTVFFYDSKKKHQLTLEGQLADIIEESMPQFARVCKATGIIYLPGQAPLEPGDVLTVAYSKYCQIQVVFEGTPYQVIEFKRNDPVPSLPKNS